MSSVVVLPESTIRWELPATVPLNEAVWQSWLAKGVEQDLRGGAFRAKAVRWIFSAGLLAAAGLWPRLTWNEPAVRFLVAAGAIVMVLQAFHSRRYVFAAVFGALALLYNPIVPALAISGGWQRALLIASALPFVASLTWREGHGLDSISGKGDPRPPGSHSGARVAPTVGEGESSRARF